mgnify:CR=1 FL=1
MVPTSSSGFTRAVRSFTGPSERNHPNKLAAPVSNTGAAFVYPAAFCPDTEGAWEKKIGPDLEGPGRSCGACRKLSGELADFLLLILWLEEFLQAANAAAVQL